MDYLPLLQKASLFSGINPAEIKGILECLKASVRHFEKDVFIITAGKETHEIGIILSGQATVYKDDILGNRSVMTLLTPPDMFAESFLCAGITTSPVTVQSVTDSDVLFLPFQRIIKTCSSCCSFHNSLIENMLGVIARKNLMLSEKIDHIAKRTTKQKIASYLLSQAAVNKGSNFSIGFDRQGLADYLCVNRSALSRELSGLAGEGILRFHRDSFTILDLEGLEDILLTE